MAPALPPGTAEVLRSEFVRFSELASDPRRRQALVMVPYVGFALLVLSSNKWTKALLKALNRVYAAEEKRGYLRFTATSLCFTLALIVMAPIAVACLVLVPALLDYLGPEMLRDRHVQWLRWPVLLLLVAGSLALM
jgi:membrane protein